MGWEGVREQQRERERGRELCWKSCSIKNLTAFPNSSRGKKVSQDAKSEKGGKKKGENYTLFLRTKTLTTDALISTSCWVSGQATKRVPRHCCQPQGGMESGDTRTHMKTDGEKKMDGKKKEKDWRQCCPARSATICKIRWLRGKVLKLFHFCCLP